MGRDPIEKQSSEYRDEPFVSGAALIISATRPLTPCTSPRSPSKTRISACSDATSPAALALASGAVRSTCHKSTASGCTRAKKWRGRQPSASGVDAASGYASKSACSCAGLHASLLQRMWIGSCPCTSVRRALSGDAPKRIASASPVHAALLQSQCTGISPWRSWTSSAAGLASMSSSNARASRDPEPHSQCSGS